MFVEKLITCMNFLFVMIINHIFESRQICSNSHLLFNMAITSLWIEAVLFEWHLSAFPLDWRMGIKIRMKYISIHILNKSDVDMWKVMFINTLLHIFV